MKWTDATSYQRDRERIPTVFQTESKNIRIVVMCSHRDYPGKWVATCHPWFDARELRVTTREQAQEEALKLVRKKLSAILMEIGV